VHVVRQPVQQGPGQPFLVGQHLGPIRKRQIRRHNQAGLLVALAEEAEQVLGPHPVQRQIAELIHNDQIAPPDRLFQLQDRSFLTGLEIGVHQSGGGEELHRVAALTRLAAEGDRQVRFAHARGAADHNVGFALDEAAACQVQNILLVQLRHVGEPVAGQFLDQRELGLFHPSLDRHGRAALHLQFRQALQEVLIGGIRLIALPGEGLVFGPQGRQLERLEIAVQEESLAAHAGTSSRLLS